MAYDTAKMSVEEIRTELVEKFGLTREAVDSIKGKKSLVNLLVAEATDAAWEATDDNGLKLFSDVPDDELTDSPLDAVAAAHDAQDLFAAETPAIPAMTDPDWSDYVVTHLTEAEMFEGAPKVSGLRRVTELLLGEIVKSETLIVQTPNPENERRATVVHRVTLAPDDEGIQRVSEGAADVYSGNSDRVYGNHPVALAETRAEGRALRRLLRLGSHVVTAEEKIKPTEKYEDFLPPDATKITEVQITGLEFLAKRTDINLAKLLDKEYPKANNITELSNDEGIKLLNILSSYQSTGVPDDLKGYDPGWRSKKVQ